MPISDRGIFRRSLTGCIAGRQPALRRLPSLVVTPEKRYGRQPALGRPPSPPVRAVGFTLIEILVVTVILGIALALAAANLMPDERQAARRETDRVALALEQARDAAVLGGNATAVSIEGEHVAHWTRANDVWQADTASSSAVTTTEVAALTVGGTPAAANERIAFLPEGVGVPFEMRLSYHGIASIVRGDALGNVHIDYAP
jgi:general secretion pathway protein H